MALLFTCLSTAAATLLIRAQYVIDVSDKCVSKNIPITILPTHCIVREKIQSEVISAICHKKNTVQDDVTKDKNAPSHVQYNHVTILNGPSGVGKTVLSIMAVKNEEVEKHFYDGIAWLSLTKRNGLSYSDLIYYYRDLCNQLSNAGLISMTTINVEQYYLPPEDEQDAKELMEELKGQMISHLELGKKRILLIVDQIINLADLTWFDFRSRNQQKEQSPFQILATTAGSIDGQLLGSKMIQISTLTSSEGYELLKREATEHTDKTTAEDITRACANLPLMIRLISCLQANKNVMQQRRGLETQTCWKKMKSALDANCFNPYQEESYQLFLAKYFSCVSEDVEIVEVLTICLSVFAVVFPENSYHKPIPWMTTCILWEKVFEKEITNNQLFAVERCIMSSNVTNNSTVHSRCSFVREQLESLGVMSSLALHGKKRIRGVYLTHDILRKYGVLHLKAKSEKYNEVDMEKFWVDLFVQSYDERFSYGEIFDDEQNEIFKQDQTYLLEHLPGLIIRSGNPEKAAKLLGDSNFIKKRHEVLGGLKGTKQHINDAEAIIHFVMEENQDERDGILSMDSIGAKNSVILMYERVTDHLLHQLHLDPGIKQDTCPAAYFAILVYALGHSLRKLEFTNEAFMLYEESVSAMAESTSSNVRFKDINNRAWSRVLYAIGVIYLKKNNHMEAIKYFTDSLHHVKSSSMGKLPKRTDVGRTLHLLGYAHFSRGDTEDALENFKRAVKVQVAITGIFSEDVAQSLFNIGIIHHETGNLDEAIKKMSEALHIRKKLHSNEHADVARTLQKIGAIYRQKDKPKQAIRFYKEAMQIWRKMLLKDEGAHSTNYAECMHNLGVLYRQCGSLDEAMSAYTEALRIRKVVLGPDHVQVAQTLHNIGIVHCEKGNHDDAIRAYAQALRVRQQVTGDKQADFAVAQTLHNIGVVLRQKGDTDVAMVAFTEALWAAKALDIEPPSVEAITERCNILFGSRTLKYPCVSARIFACGSLMVDSMIKKEATVGVTTNNAGDTTLMNWIRPIFPLLTAFVEAEIVVIEGHYNDNGNDGPISDPDRRPSIQFCAFDFSSVVSPVDMIVGSNAHLERSIEAMQQIFEEVDLLCRNESETREEVSWHMTGRSSKSEIAQLLLVLHAMASRATGVALRSVCAEAMPNVEIWPETRFVRAAEQYKTEFEAIVALIESRNECPTAVRPSTTPLRMRLSTYIGSAIRFHIRRLFDNTPMSYTMPSESQPYQDFSNCRARTYELVEMVAPEGLAEGVGGEGGSNLWEAPVSYVLNKALRHLHEYYNCLSDISATKGKDNELTSPSSLSSPSKQSLYSLFSLSQASRRSLQEGNQMRTISDSDLDEILVDIHLAHVMLVSSRAASFILNLFRWPGVESAIRDAGGWGCIESLSSILLLHRLDMDSPEESHFMLLSSVGRFVNRLEKESDAMARASEASKMVLQMFWKRFKRGGGSRKKLTSEGIIREALIEGTSTVIFPNLITPEYEYDDEDDQTNTTEN